ncbi:MAG: PAS domain-containing protein [Candidatus Hodarchaeales archaeon]|jgi:PAS domain S-box-containing protein
MDPREQIINELVEKGVFEAIGDGISIQDTNFKVLYQNKVHISMIGAHAGEYCYHAYEKREKRCEGCPLAETFKDGEIHTRERSAPTDKGTIYVEITSSPIKVPTGEIIAGIEVVRDITERKKTEDALEKSENELRSIYNAITDFLTVISPDYRILSTNRVVEKRFGRDLVGKTCYEVYQARNEICPHCPTKKTIETKKPSYSFQPATEVSPPVDINAFPILDDKGEVIAIVEHGKDVTERNKTLEELIEKMEELVKYYKISGRSYRVKDITEEIEQLKYRLLGNKK